MDRAACPYAYDQDLVGRYLSSRLAKEEGDAFEAHYFACEHCWSQLREAQEIRAALLQPSAVTVLDAANAPSPIDDYLARTPTLEIERIQLLLQLTRSEWDIARVARLRGVSRVTIYNQMKRLGIRREKVLKVGRARQKQGDST